MNHVEPSVCPEMNVNEKMVARFCKSPFIPYRFKKSVAKRFIPGFLHDCPFEQEFFGFIYQGNAANYIDRIVFLCGAYEKFMLFFLRDLVSALSLEEGVFLDIGANVGNHAIFISRLMREVHAFEPYDEVLGELQNKISINGITNIYIHPTGLGNCEGSLPFYTPQGRNLGTGSFHPDFKAGGNHYRSLPITTGDRFIEENNIKDIEIIKIDVEGHERPVLEGLVDTIKRFDPVVIFEMSPETRQRFDGAADFVASFPLHYRFFRFARADMDNGKYRLGKFCFGQNYRNQDVIAIPDRKYSKLIHSIPGLN